MDIYRLSFWGDLRRSEIGYEATLNRRLLTAYITEVSLIILPVEVLNDVRLSFAVSWVYI